MVKFLVLALFYGDHPALAARCGATLRALWNTGRVDVRVGLNEASPRTQVVLRELLPGVDGLAADPQIHKYPMMRRLLQTYQGDATHLMWFDDDSCLLPGLDPHAWLDAVAQRAQPLQGTMGALHTYALTQAQRDWIRQQPWATGREPPATLSFNVGGWFVAPLALLRRHDYPFANLRHAGDLALGALLHQHGLQAEHFRVGLAINADAQLRESTAQRRGTSETGLQ